MIPTSVQALMAVALTVAPLVHASNGWAGSPLRFSMVSHRSGDGADLFVPDKAGEPGVTGVPVLGYAPALSVTNFGDKIAAGFEVLANRGAYAYYNNTTYTGFSDAFCPVAHQADPVPGSLFSVPGAGSMASADSKKVVHMNPVAAQKRPALSLVTNPARVLTTPSFAYRISENHSISFSPTIALEIFRAYGFDRFTGLSGDSSRLVGRGNDDPRVVETFGGSGYSTEGKMNRHAVEISYGWLF